MSLFQYCTNNDNIVLINGWSIARHAQVNNLCFLPLFNLHKLDRTVQNYKYSSLQLGQHHQDFLVVHAVLGLPTKKVFPINKFIVASWPLSSNSNLTLPQTKIDKKNNNHHLYLPWAVFNLNTSNYLYPIAINFACSHISTLHLSICFTLVLD